MIVSAAYPLRVALAHNQSSLNKALADHAKHDCSMHHAVGAPSTPHPKPRSIKLNAVEVPKGKYSMWMKLTSATAWTMVLDRDFHRYHEERRWERARAALQVDVSPSLLMTMPANEAAPYLGVYTYTSLDDAGKPRETTIGARAIRKP